MPSGLSKGAAAQSLDQHLREEVAHMAGTGLQDNKLLIKLLSLLRNCLWESWAVGKSLWQAEL